MSTEDDPRAVASFWSALDAAHQRDQMNDTYTDVDIDCIDGRGSEVLRALLSAGWEPPI